MVNKLKFYYQNTRGLRGKIANNLKKNITLANYHCISLTETWLSDKFESSEIFNETYNVYRADRTVNKYNTLKINRPDLQPDDDVVGGGCLVALKRDVSALRMTEWEDEIPFDNVWLKINTHGNSKIFINTIYIPGWASFEHMNLYFEQLFDIINIREPNSRFIILGDFNLPCIEWFYDGNHCLPITFQGRAANELISTMLTTNLLQRNPIRNIYNRTLDLIISNINIEVKKANKITKEDDYHPSLQFDLDKTNIQFLKSTKTSKYNFFKTNYESLNDDINKVDWKNELNCLNVDTAVTKFYHILRGLLHKHTPIIAPKTHEYPKWYSSKLLQLLKEKWCYKKRMNGPNKELFTTLFKSKRKECTREKKSCLHKYESSIESLIKSNSKSFFAYTKAQKQSNNFPASVHYKSKIAENMKETACLFADYFSSVYVHHNSTLQLNNTNNAYDYFNLNMIDIETAILSLNENKSNSPDGIPSVVFKRTIHSIKYPLYLLFQLSLNTMIYPTEWKISFITPILKSGDISNVVNYRPISILSTISKVFDKIIFKYIQTKTLHLLSPHQHGFTPGKSTITNLLEFSDYITKGMMGGGQIDVVFMDLAKAFDRIDHAILLSKLSHLPIDQGIIKLLLSYLSNRTQIVCVGGEKNRYPSIRNHLCHRAPFSHLYCLLSSSMI